MAKRKGLRAVAIGGVVAGVILITIGILGYFVMTNGLLNGHFLGILEGIWDESISVGIAFLIVGIFAWFGLRL